MAQGTPNARQISFGTSVVPKLEESSTSTQVIREDGVAAGVAQYDDVILDTTINKRFGGKGLVTIAADQEIDGWVSFTHPMSVISDGAHGMDQAWNDTELNWDEVVEIYSNDFTIRNDSPAVPCNFIYVKNTGSTYDARLILDDTEPDILIPPGASISLRLNSVDSDIIKIDAAHSDGTTIEYVLAKE